jgi:hypothetical protein
MSGVFRTIGAIAGIAASIPGPHQPIAAAVAVTASIGAAVTATKPPAQGSTTEITIGADQATPMMLGDTYSPGARVLQKGYGGTVGKVTNPYAGIADVYSAGGPIAGIDQVLVDFEEVTFDEGDEAQGFLDDYFYRRLSLGDVPQATALTGHWGPVPGFGADATMSGLAHVLYSLEFDPRGKRFSSGVPQLGVRGRGVATWDPRADSTQAGGLGPQRWADPADTAAFDAARLTWIYTARPGLHGLRYALGTWERDPRVPGSRYQLRFGVGMPLDQIVVEDFCALETICEANGWEVSALIYEPGDKWANLKRILEAGGAEPCWKGGRLGVKMTAPRVSLDTITRDDLASGDIRAQGAAGWRDVINAVIPKAKSPDHKWELQQSTEIVVPELVAQDGEKKPREIPFETVKVATQAAQLAAYKLWGSREFGPLDVPILPRLRRYNGGDRLTLHPDIVEDLGVPHGEVVVVQRAWNALTMTGTLTVIGETAAKHAHALAQIGAFPPPIGLTGPEERDGAAASTTADLVTTDELEAAIGGTSAYLALGPIRGSEFGLVGRETEENDGSAPDETAKLQAMIALAQSERRWISLPRGRHFVINQSLLIGVGAPRLIIEGNGSTLDMTQQGVADTQLSSNALLINGTLVPGSSVLVTADIVAGITRQITVASTAGMAAGDYIRITSTHYYIEQATTADLFYRGEMHQVVSVDSSTQFTIRDPALFDYLATGFNLRVSRFIPVVGPKIEGLHVRGRGAGYTQNAIQMNYVVDPVIRECVGRLCEATIIRGSWLLGGVIEDNDFSDATNPALYSGVEGDDIRLTIGYGIGIFEGSQGVTAQRNRITNCRHAVAAGGNYPVVRARILHNTAIGCGHNAAAFDAHEPCFWMEYGHNTVQGGTKGFGLRGQEIDCHHNFVKGTDKTGIEVHVYSVASPLGQRDIRLRANRVLDTGGYGIHLRGDPLMRIKAPQLDGNICRRNGLDNIKVMYTDDPSIAGGLLDAPIAPDPGADGRNIRVSGTDNPENIDDFCTNVSISNVKMRSAPVTAILAEFTKGITVDQADTEGAIAFSARFTSCTDVSLTGGSYGGGATENGHAIYLEDTIGFIASGVTFPGKPIHTAADAISVRGACSRVVVTGCTGTGFRTLLSSRPNNSTSDYLYSFGNVVVGFSASPGVVTTSAAHFRHLNDDSRVGEVTVWDSDASNNFARADVGEYLLLSGPRTFARTYTLGAGFTKGERVTVSNQTTGGFDLNVRDAVTDTVLVGIAPGKAAIFYHTGAQLALFSGPA